MILAALAGLGLGVAAAFVREAFDQALRTPTDMETELTAPLLGSIPVLKKNQTPRQALADSRSPMAEAYQSLRSALQFSTVDGFPQTLLITSPWPGGGKTTTAFALSQYVARLGFRVLLIDADLRNPSVGELFGARGGAGLTNLLTGAASLKQVILSTEFANLYLVISGPPAPGPVELLSGMRLPRLIAEAASLFDMIILDGPPVMDLADAPIIGSVVAGCLLVVEAGRTTRGHVRRSLRRLSQAGAHILGAVLTKYRPAHDTQGAGYGYGGAYGYPDTAGQQGGAVARLLSRARRRLMAK
jgi:capsular exopolysaccharide synthesis family protein